MGARANIDNRFRRRLLVRLAAVCILAAALIAFWQYSPLGEWSDPEYLRVMLNGLRANPWAGPIVVGVFLLGTFVVFPVTALVAATGIALGPTRGLLWASVGSLVAAVVTYWIARMAVPEHMLDRWLGAWSGRMRRRFQRSGIVAVMVARNVPIAPFTLINVVAGASRIPLRDYLIGTCLGMGPTVAALTVLGDRLRGAWESPTPLNVALLCIAIAAWFLLALGLQTLSNRMVAAR